MGKLENTEQVDKRDSKKQETLLKPFIKLRTERFSTLSHLFGTILFFFGTLFLTIHAIGDTIGVLFSLIYGLSNVFLFFSSTMCHSQRKEEYEQDIWTLMDHITQVISSPGIIRFG